MQLTAVFLLAGALTVTASAKTQSITFTGKDVPFTKIIEVIEAQTNYSALTDAEVIKSIAPVTIEANNMPLKDFLTQALMHQPISFFFDGNNIFFSKKVIGAPKVELNKTQPPITGIVKGADGKPLANVNVTVKGKRGGTSTNSDGYFNIDANAGDILIFTSVEAETKEYKITSNTNEAIVVALNVRSSSLDEVIVKPYSTTTRRNDVGGGISTITSKQIETKPISNPLLALQGEVPGVYLAQANGLSNSAVTVQIRGINSLSNGAQPLYVVDGVPYTTDMLPGNAGANLGSDGSDKQYGEKYGNPLNFINPAIIESISVLKDADATSIYGSRAANGAILITTKKGKSGSNRISANFQTGGGKVSRKLDLLNREEYLQMRHDAFAYDGLSPGEYDYDLNGVWDTTRYTDWQKFFLGGTSGYSDVQLVSSGGSDQIQYLIGMGYHRESPMFPKFIGSVDNFNRKISSNFNISNKSANGKLKILVSGAYMTDINFPVGLDLTYLAINLSPVAPSLFNPDGSLNWQPGFSGESSWTNPLGKLRRKNKILTNNLISNALISYEIVPNLTLKSNFGYNNMQVDELTGYPASAVAPDEKEYYTRESSFSNGYISSWIAEPQLSYKFYKANSKLEALIGASFQQKNAYQKRLLAYNYTSDILLEDPGAAPNLQYLSTLSTLYKYNAGFGAVNYTFQDKYGINLSLRRDGSSRFGADNIFHNFYSIAYAWTFSNEKWISQKFSVLSFGKFRMSYGTTGNDQIGDYQFLSIYFKNFPYQETIGFTPAWLPNPQLQWELTKKFQVGVDLGFFDDKLLVTGNYYRNQSSNQLLEYKLPMITGYASITSNFPALIRNEGVEFNITATIFKRTALNWTTGFNLSFNHNKLVSFPGIETSSYANEYIVGESVLYRRVYTYAGIDPATGLFSFIDSKGAMTSTPQAPNDLTKTVNLSPQFYGGLSNTLTFRRFQVYLLIQFSRMNGINYNAGSYPGQFNGYRNLGNQPKSVLDPGKHQPYSTNYNGDIGIAFNSINGSDYIFDKISYARIKNLSLSYQISDSWVRKTRIQSCRVFGNVQNLLTVTNYTGVDPENMSFTSLPPLRVFSFGFQLSL